MFLAWWSAFGSKARGGQEAWADAPEMETDDMIAWNFYMRSATPFVRDFGLMGGRIAEMPYEGVAKEIFIEKLSAVHNAIMARAVAEAREGGDEEKPQIVIAGSENG